MFKKKTTTDFTGPVEESNYVNDSYLPEILSPTLGTQATW